MASKIGKEALNTFSGGMNLDVDSSLLNSNQYRYAEDARVSSVDGSLFGSISQIESPLLVLDIGNVSWAHTNSSRDIGVLFANSSTHGIIYRLTYNGGDSISSKEIFRSTHKFTQKMTSVIRYDNSDNIRCYFSEEDNPIRVIDISPSADTYNLSISGNIDLLSIYPPFSSSKPVINKILPGRLNAGKIQYCYSMYSEFGTETSLSPLSDMVNLTSSETGSSSMDVTGTNRGESSGLPAGKAVSISIDIPSGNKYNGIKIYSVYYSSSQGEPVISLIADKDIDSTISKFTYVDAGSPALSELLVSEFNAMSQFKFMPSKIESKDDILFAADIKEIKPSFSEYDVRSFRFNSAGRALIHDSSLENYLDLSYADIASGAVPDKHDCIMKEMYEKTNSGDLEYIYNKDGVLGGSGKNVDFLFSNTYLIESYGNYMQNGANQGRIGAHTMTKSKRYIDNRIPRVGDVTRDIRDILIKNSNGSSELIEDMFNHVGQMNYSNPILANKFASYHRDEIYRFAAILHDANGNKSDAKWIADIRFPSNWFKDDLFDACSFLNPQESYIEDLNINGALIQQQELLVKPLGLKFTFRNVPSDVRKIEIVRSKRDINNRTIFAQGVLQKIGTKKRELLDTSDNLTFYRGQDNTLRPHPVIAMGYSYSISGPHINVIPDDPFYQEHGMHGVSETASSFSGENNNDNGSQTYVNYTDHAIAPFFVNKNYNLFVNPESSYYGDEFVGQILKSATSPSLSIDNIIFPKSTPLTVNTTTNSRGSGYFGNEYFAIYSLTRRTSTSGSSTWPYRPTMLYMGADISDSMLDAYGLNVSTAQRSDSIFPLAGLAGARLEASSEGGSHNYDSFTNSVSAGPSVFNVYHPSTGSFNDGSQRVYISLGNSSIFTHIDPYNSRRRRTWNGITSTTPIFNWGVSPTYAFQSSALISKLQEIGYPSVSFKYYCSFDKKTAISNNNYGGVEFSLLTQPEVGLANFNDRVTYSSVGELGSFKINSMVYSGRIDSGVDLNMTSQYQKTISGESYLNWSAGLLRGDGSEWAGQDNTHYAFPLRSSRVNGAHGDGIVLSFDNQNQIPSVCKILMTRKKYSSASSVQSWMRDYSYNSMLDTHLSSAMSTFVANIKSMNFGIYGGQTYDDKLYSEYISTGAIFNTSLSREGLYASGYVFGGDTYIGVFDYTVVKITDQMMDPGINEDIRRAQNYKVSRVGAMIPLESSINMRMSTSKTYSYDNNSFCIQDSPGVYGPGNSMGDEFTYTQKSPQFEYNSAYSAEQSAKVYLTDINSSENTVHDNRVLASEKKNYGEKFDSWSTFKPANYIDADSKYGKITGLKSFDNKLIFWQQNAVGALSVNDRSLIQDNNIGQLTLGTGGILSRYDYISTTNGLSPDSINSIGSSNNKLYWFDKGRHEVMSISNNVSSASKVGGIQSAIERNKGNILNNVPIAYDAINNEMLITINGLKDKEEWLDKR